MLCTGGDPKPSLALEDLKEDGGGAHLLSKTLALRSFQIIQLTSMVMKDIAFRLLVALKNILDHQNFRDR
jgi:hypothetical protein